MITLYRMTLPCVADAYQTHRSVMAQFPDMNVEDPRRAMAILWRRESRDSITVQSTVAVGVVTHVALTVGECVRLRVVAAPSKRDARTGKVVMVSKPEWDAWVRQKLVGFAVDEVTTIEPRERWEHYVCGRKGRHEITHVRAEWTCMARVRDVSQAESMIIHGIGRGRAFGLGMVEVCHAD